MENIANDKKKYILYLEELQIASHSQYPYIAIIENNVPMKKPLVKNSRIKKKEAKAIPVKILFSIFSNYVIRRIQ